MAIASWAYALAALGQFLIGTFVFGTVYAAVLYVLRWPANALTCGAIGAVHGVLVGLSLPIVERLDPGMRSGRIRPPGLLATNYGALAAVGLVGAHVLYGVLYGVTYAGGGRLFPLKSAWLAGFVGTAALTALLLAAKFLQLAPIGPLEVLAASLDAVLRRRPRPTARGTPTA